MDSISQEERVQLALKAFKDGQFKTKKAASLAFDVPETTLRRRIQGIASRSERAYNGLKLSPTEESTLSAWILDMDRRGLPLQLPIVSYLAQLLLSARLSQPSHSIIIGGHWVNRFIRRHPELKSRYTRKLDYQRAKCEDSKLIKAWFARVQETIEKYGIMKENIYNMDETGFQMGVASTTKVVCGSETKQSHARALQPGNREWVTAIVAVNAMGWSLPPQIIFAAAKHQSLWYHDLPEKYVLSVSQNGWTTDKLGIEWLQKVFEPNTTPQAGYRLLILDGHGSHATAEFDRFCMEKKIIPLYMPPHSSHLLQPLDVSCFSPLKHLYGQRVQEEIQKGIHSVGKEDFIHIYPAVHQQALSSLNIQSGFAATGLVPLSPERVLSKFQKTPTPPSTSHSNQSTQSFGVGKTPVNLHQLEHQKKKIAYFKQHIDVVSPSLMDKAMEKVIKGAEMTMQNALLLQQQNYQLQEAHQYRRKRKERAKHFIQDGGSLTVAEVRQQEEEQRRELERDAQSQPSRPRRPQKCSNCGVVGHNRRQCTSR